MIHPQIPRTEGPRLQSRRYRTQGFAFLVAVGIFLSRLAGLVREHVFARYFGGTSIAAGVFRAGLRIPNFLQNLLGEGVLSAGFIPVYARLLAQGDEETAGKVAGAIASILALVVSITVVLGMTLTPWIVDLIVPGFTGEARVLTIRVVRILFPGVGILVLSAWCLGVLNSQRKFFLSYVAPVLWNAAMIGTMIVFGSRLGQISLAVALAWGTVAGSALQLAIQAPFVFRYAKKIRFQIASSLPPVRTVLRNTVPAILSRGVVQISAYVDQLIASFLRNGTGAVSVLGYAQTIYLLPVSLFGMSVAAAELPQMSSAIGSRDEINASLRKRLQSGVRQVAFFIIPTVAAFVLIGRALVAAIYQTGHFGKADSVYVWYVLAGSAIGMLAVTRGRIYNSAFYALHDTTTPLRFATVRVTLTALLGYLFAFPLRPLIEWTFTGLFRLPAPRPEDTALVFGAAGLTSSAGIAGWVEYLLLRRAMGKRIGGITIATSYYSKLWACALIAGVLGLGITSALPWLHGLARVSVSLEPAFDGVIVAGVFGLAYLGTTWIMGIEEAKRLLRR
jgi:putative peptidoglycan lipid II flippase